MTQLLYVIVESRQHGTLRSCVQWKAVINQLYSIQPDLQHCVLIKYLMSWKYLDHTRTLLFLQVLPGIMVSVLQSAFSQLYSFCLPAELAFMILVKYLAAYLQTVTHLSINTAQRRVTWVHAPSDVATKPNPTWVVNCNSDNAVLFYHPTHK